MNIDAREIYKLEIRLLRVRTRTVYLKVISKSEIQRNRGPIFKPRDRLTLH